MTRAVHVNTTAEAAEALCDKHSIRISTLEKLLSGGTRVILQSADGAENFRRLAKRDIIDGPVKRAPLQMSRHPTSSRRGDRAPAKM